MSGKKVTVLVVDDLKERIKDIKVLPMVYPIQKPGKENRRTRRARERKSGIKPTS
jgi:predicted alpha/beta-hydrolase family hydrolase